MKRLFFYFMLVSCVGVLSSCSEGLGEDLLGQDSQGSRVGDKQTRAMVGTSGDSILPLEETDEYRRMHEALLQRSKKVAVPPSYADYDEYFSSNVYGIRELPIHISVRSVASGSSSTNKYLACSSKGAEAYLSNDSAYAGTKFHLKVLPASTGIPYLIYSQKSWTPLCVGYYTNNPDTKILMSAKTDDGSLFSASWDLLASPSNKGYFSIESSSYLGQADPNNMWSVFNYVLEAKANNKIGYAQPVSGKAQQEFLIQPINLFTVDYINFDASTAKISSLTPLKVISYGKNETEERRNFSITASHYANETFRFSETGRLKVFSSNSTKFYWPKVAANKLIVPSPVNPSEEPNKDEFRSGLEYSTVQNTNRTTLTIETNGIAKPNSLIEVTSYLKGYSISVDYVAEMYCYVGGEKRTVKIKGTWYGSYYTTERAQPDIVKCFDLDDGEELSLLKKSNKLVISKTFLK